MTYTSYFEFKAYSDTLDKIRTLQTQLKNRLVTQKQYMNKMASILREFEIIIKQNNAIVSVK